MRSKATLAGIAGGIIIIGIIAFMLLNNNQGSTDMVQQEPNPSIIQLLESPAAPPEVMSMLLNGPYPALGHPDAPIILVEFGDYQCHFCHQFFENTEEDIISNYIDTGIVRLVFRDFTIIGPDSITAAHGARCANDQDMFWKYHDEVYSNWDGENTGWVNIDSLSQYATNVGVDTISWNACMEAGTHYNSMTASTQAARSLDINGTPAFFVIAPNGGVLRIPGAQPYDVFQSVFDDIIRVSGAQPAT